ncbi:GSCFA domain-containing protein [Brevundimonas intermedia]|uniref:GSCFA domain-containing protein n=1 Tax=Brevundimonas intermedia TaxID=74315 RepID=UPI00320ABB6F
MKITVVGNCQGDSLAICLKAMNPDLDVEFILITDIRNGTRPPADIFSQSDKVFAQPHVKDDLGNDPEGKVSYFPAVAFPAFHPDMTYVTGVRKDGEKETVHSPMVIYHSAIALFGYVHEVSIDDLCGWYNRYVFNKFGYFDVWDSARADLLAEGELAGLPLGFLFEQWRARGNFMYSFNHPRLAVMADIARALLVRERLPIINQNVADYLDDPLRSMSIWPVYPHIAERLGLQGDLNFKSHEPGVTYSIRQFLESSYQLYDLYERDTLSATTVSMDELRKKLEVQELTEEAAAHRRKNPYSGARSEQFWRNSVAGVAPAALDPVVDPRFSIQKNEKVATAGSCFAQHIARTLARSGFNYFVPEQPVDGVDGDEARERNYGVYSARYGNIYTVRQLLQLLQRVNGEFVPSDDVWARKDGRLVDPFRPQIEPEGFADHAALVASREEHFTAVRKMLNEMDIFVFTLGLTEGWQSRYDGAVFPLAPAVAGGEMDFETYEFVNFSAESIRNDLFQVIDRLRVINPGCKIILTVSPVPLIATYEPRHALVATTYSKSVLRTVADEARRAFGHVEYFPSYEIITGHYNKGAYFSEDLREVREEGVKHVMGVFMNHYAQSEEVGPSLITPASEPAKPAPTGKRKLFDIVCDEEAILNM